MTLLQRIRTAGNRVRPASADEVPPVVVDPYEPVAPETFTVPYSLPSGSTITVGSDGGDDYDTTELQDAIDAASAGDVIVLRAGDTFTGNFVLPNKGTDSEWTYIISSGLASLPAEGTRVAPADETNMPKIVSGNSSSAIRGAYGANHYRLAGISISNANDANNLVVLSSNGSTQATTVANLCSHITFDRCYLYSSDDAKYLVHGIILNGAYVAVVDSYISNVKAGPDSQAIWSQNGTGPFKIVNNFLEGSGENIMFGGGDPSISGLIPADIEIRGNHLYKRTSWKSPDTWNIKNLLEFKNAKRAHVEGNVLENCWRDAQGGAAILFTPRNQDGTADWSTVTDIKIINNVSYNTAAWIEMLGQDNAYESGNLRRVWIENNFAGKVTYENTVEGLSSPRFLRWTTPVSTSWGDNGPGLPALYITVKNNLMLFDEDYNVNGGNYALSVENASLIQVDGLRIYNNIWMYGLYSSSGVDSSRVDNLDQQKNVLITLPDSDRYSENRALFATTNPNDFEADPGPTAVGFVDYAGGDYAAGDYVLDGESDFIGVGVDGVDPGPDWTALLDAISGAVP